MSTAEHSTSRGLITSMMVIGYAQAVNIGLSIFRMKVLAVLLGPSGIGLLSIYNSLQSMVSQAAGLGMSTSGVREIADFSSGSGYIVLPSDHYDEADYYRDYKQSVGSIWRSL